MFFRSPAVIETISKLRREVGEKALWRSFQIN